MVIATGEDAILPINYNQEVEALLLADDLPVSDLRNDSAVQLFGISHQQILETVIGLEIYDDSALLRSLVVVPRSRNKGYARKLVAFVEQKAGQCGADDLYLLTTTAEQWFTKHS